MIDFSQLKNIQYPNDMLSPIYMRYTNIPPNLPKLYYGVKVYEAPMFDNSLAEVPFPRLRDVTVQRILVMQLRQRYV